MKIYKLRQMKTAGSGFLNCPFCGNTPFECSSGNGQFIIKCYACGIIMTQDRKDKLIGIWNNRIQSETFAEAKKEGIEQMRDAYIDRGKAIYSQTFDEPFIDTGSIRRIAEEEIKKL